jgi:hypothetical protein
MRRFLLSTASLVAGFAFGLILATSPGCAWFAVEVPQPKQDTIGGADKPPPKPASVKPKTVDELEKELAAAKEAQVKADQLVELKEKQLKDARTEERQHKLYWLVGICFLGLLGCVAGAICISGLAKYFTYGAIACAAMALLCLGVAELLPYMPYILLGLGIIGGFALFAWWRLDHKGLQQVATAVEGIKGQLPGYKEHFRQVIDGDVDAWLNRVRKNLGLLGKK